MSRAWLYLVSSCLDLVGLALDVLIDALDALRRRTDAHNWEVWERWMDETDA